MKYLIVLLILFSSCRTAKVVQYESIVRDSVVYREVEKEIFVPGFDIESKTVNIDSIRKWLDKGVKPEIIQQKLYYQDKETLAKVGFLIDELGNLTAICEQQDRIIEQMILEKETFRYEFEKTVLEEKRNIIDKVKSAFYGFLTILSIIATIIIIYIIFKTKNR